MLKKELKLKRNLDFELDIQEHRQTIHNQIFNKKVLIIGGAGTIGSNYTKQILAFKPSKLVIVDFNENGLTEITRDLRSSNLLDYKPEFITYPVNLLSVTFDKIFWSDNFDIVANFSAHKHVRSEKDLISIEALLKNNVFGAIKLLELCSLRPPRNFFSVSTDKAANPVNVMGASKFLMEKLILSKQKEFKVSTARFANVAFSNGSLLDGFVYRLNKNQPISCPSDIKRFFVTPEQSGQICLLATFLGKSGNIFFPKLNFYEDQIYFKDIAIEFLNNNGLEPVEVQSEKEAKEYVIKENLYPVLFFKTDTSGEKKYEEFYSKDESTNLNKYHTLGFIEKTETIIQFNDIKESFLQIFKNPISTKSDLIKVLQKYVPQFEHFDTGKNLDEKM